MQQKREPGSSAPVGMQKAHQGFHGHQKGTSPQSAHVRAHTQYPHALRAAPAAAPSTHPPLLDVDAGDEADGAEDAANVVQPALDSDLQYGSGGHIASKIAVQRVGWRGGKAVLCAVKRLRPGILSRAGQVGEGWARTWVWLRCWEGSDTPPGPTRMAAAEVSAMGPCGRGKKAHMTNQDRHHRDREEGREQKQSSKQHSAARCRGAQKIGVDYPALGPQSTPSTHLVLEQHAHEAAGEHPERVGVGLAGAQLLALLVHNDDGGRAPAGGGGNAGR